MKPLVYTFVFLLGLTFIGAHTSAQNRRSRVRPRAQVTKSQNGEDIDLESSGGEGKILKECEMPDRPKPEGDIKRVSQLCGHALSMPKPAYPEEAKSKGVSGIVEVDVVTDQLGRVIWAKAISGPDLLQSVSMKAACHARYSPTVISGQAIRTETSIRYNFVLP
jgi:TonB family protein